MSNYIPPQELFYAAPADYKPHYHQQQQFSSGVYHNFNSAPTFTPSSSSPPSVSALLGGTAVAAWGMERRLPKPPPGYFEQLAGIGLGVGNLFAETLLSHPCVVLRRQCQVNNRLVKCHLTPFTLIPALYTLPNVSSNGLMCFWKGVPSTILLRCMCYASDSMLGDFFGLPKEATRYSSYGKISSHLLLKGITFALTTPFVISNVAETVQSDVIVDRPGLLDCIKEGFLRVSSDIMGSRDTRRIPIWNLVGPSVAHRLSHYVLSSLTRYSIHSVVKKQIMNKPSQERTLFDDFFPDLFASFASCLLADAVLFPIETIVHRLYLQGLRTIVDNLDSGAAVVPITTRYEGFIDCAQCILRDEGLCGFYKGFGALLLQYTLHMLVLRALRLLFERLEEGRRAAAGPPPLLGPPIGQVTNNQQPPIFDNRGF